MRKVSFLNACPFDYTVFVVTGKVWGLVNRFNHISWMAIVTPTVHPRSVRNHCVIEHFGGVFVLSFGFVFWWYKGFCNWTESDPFLFLPPRKRFSQLYLLVR